MKAYETIKDRLFEFEDIERETIRVSKEIEAKIAKLDHTPIVVCVLKGATPFFALLIKHIKQEIETDFMLVSSYNGTTESSGYVRTILDIKSDLTDKTVILVEDVIDTGRTLDAIKKMVKLKGARNIYTATMIDKPEKRKVKLKADFVGFTIGDEFIVGFGLDLNERLRNLPYVATCDTKKAKEYLKNADK